MLLFAVSKKSHILLHQENVIPSILLTLGHFIYYSDGHNRQVKARTKMKTEKIAVYKSSALGVFPGKI